MTREEIEKNRQYQLTSAAIDYCRKELPHYDGEALGEIVDAFEEGAEWADEHPKEGLVSLDKACEWLWNEIYERIDDSDIRESLYDDNYRATLVAAFREAMEE